MDATIAPAAALMGEPTRAAMLVALIEGRALAAGELARRAGVSAATASAHLARLLDGDLVTVIKQGRHRYYQLAGPDVAAAIEALSRLSPAGTAADQPAPGQGPGTRSSRPGPATTIWPARSASSSTHDGRARHVGRRSSGAVQSAMPAVGRARDRAGRVGRQRRAFARPCLDWTERAPHLAGALGAALLTGCSCWTGCAGRPAAAGA